ncbi:MAG: hypothetical protein Q8L45_01715 [Xanthomonadaceae bacterium]|nr:hypothetical protein [Xanthomonadaceae bacterium]MDP2185022.1 hypothetical protein [Xanthomonadales bacterium]MDZ4114401.1 hypothetical protein [Xanthomonadaceae bacterium]
MLGPFDITPVIDRLRASVPTLRQVAGAAELDAAMNSVNASTVPAAYVLPALESAGETRGSSQRLIQIVSVTVAVVIAVRNYRRADLGSAAGADLGGVVAAVRSAVLGWTPPGGEKPFDFKAGRLERRQDAALWWQDLYRTQYRIEVTA